MKFFHLTFFFLISLFPIILFAQSNFKKGQIVNLKGDSTSGYIDYRDWQINPSFILFKLQPGDKAIQKLNAQQLLKFKVDNLDSFIRYTGIINKTSRQLQDSGSSPADMGHHNPVFLKVIYKSLKVNLYSYENSNGTHYFFSEAPNNNPQELNENNVLVGVESSNAENDLSRINYKKQLFELAVKYHSLNDKLQNAIENSSYAQMDLLNIIEGLNGDIKSKIKSHQNKGLKNFDIFAGIGINSANFTNSDGQYSLDGGKEFTSYLPRLTLGFDLYPNPETHKVILKVELALGQNKYKSVYTEKLSPYNNLLYSFSESYISLIPQINYNIYNGENFRFFAGIGFSINYSKYSNTIFTQTNGQPTGLSIVPIYNNGFSISVQPKIGLLLFKKVEVYINYLPSEAVTKEGYFKIFVSSLQGGINYIL